MYGTGNYTISQLPADAEFRQSYDYDAAQDKFTKSVLDPTSLLSKLLHRPVSVSPWQLQQQA
jgi:hypothetical protein